VIVEAIAQWQYLIMGATACTLMAIVLMSIYIADLHHRLNQLSEAHDQRNAVLQADMDMVRRQVHKQEEQAYWRQQAGTWTQ
jgi:hypothetical protein